MDNSSAERLIEESKRRSVPGLHPGLNDLIRVLGKQAHCASRTLILCEPHIPTKVRKTNYHKHCSPKRRNSLDTVIRTAALWSPIRPYSYYYNCFNYTHYPERDTDYQDIERRYLALKDKPLIYDPPKCDEKRIRRSLERSDVRHKKRTDRMVDSHPHQSKTKTDEISNLVFSSDEIGPIVLLTSSEEVSQKRLPEQQVPRSQQQNLKEPSLQYASDSSGTSRSGDERATKPQSSKRPGPSSRQQNLNEPSLKSGKNLTRTTEGRVGSEQQSIPWAELTNIRNLIQKSERENFERMQQMLLLMKELSTKDFCRATCDQVGERYDETGFGGLRNQGGVTPSGEPLRKKVKDSRVKTMKPQASADHFDKYEYDSSDPEEQGSGYVTDSSNTSKGSSKISKGTPSSKSKSSTNLNSSSSEESLGKEASSENEGEGPTESESEESSRDKSDVDVAPSRSRSSQKITGYKSQDSVRDNKSKDSVRDGKSKDSIRDGKSKDSVRTPSSHENVQKPFLLNVCDSPMTVHELVEVSSIITDILVLETVNELMQNGKYTPPSRRQDDVWRGGSPPLVSEGTVESPFEVKDRRTLKPIISDRTLRERSNVKDLKSVSLPRASAMESYKASKRSPEPEVTSLTESDGARASPKPDERPRKRKASRESRVDSVKSKTSGRSKVDSTRSKVDEKSMKSPAQSIKSKIVDDSKAESLKSRGREGSLKSRVSEDSKADSVRSGGSKADSTGSKVDEVPMKSKVSEASRSHSKKSKLGEESKTQSLKSKEREGSRVSEESRTESPRPTLGEGSLKSTNRVESTKEQPGSESTKSKLAEESKAELIKSRGATSTKSKTSDQSKVESKSKESEGSRTHSQKSRLTEESKSSSGSTPGTAKPSGVSKTTLKSIAEKSETSEVSRVSPSPEGSQPSRTGHRRRSSCPKHSRSPSPSADRGSIASSRSSQVSAEMKRISDIASSSPVRSKTERLGRLSGEVSKLSPIDSVCEREDSQVCPDYKTDNTVLYYVRITENAFPPEKERYNSAGFMLKSAYDYTIPPRGQVNIKTDLVLELPPHSYGRIAARKCLAVNFGIDVGADVIDRDFRENVTILLFNHSDKPFYIRKGNKVAQLICESIQLAAAKEKCDLINTLRS